jgi:multidrug efflux system membrane fusion protein
MVSVKPGVNDGGMTQVESIPGSQGINPGDVVANSSFDKLQDKVKVAISNKPAGTNNPASANSSGSSGP